MSSTNLLQPANFKIVINSNSYHNMEFYTQSCDHPSVSLNAAISPYKKASKVPSAGDTLEFGEVTFNVLLDENMKSYTEIFDWMHRLVHNNRVSQNEGAISGIDPDAAEISLIIMSSSNTKIKEIVYHNCLPINLGNINFETSTNSVEPIIVPVTFEYLNFSIK